MRTCACTSQECAVGVQDPVELHVTVASLSKERRQWSGRRSPAARPSQTLSALVQAGFDTSARAPGKGAHLVASRRCETPKE